MSDTVYENPGLKRVGEVQTSIKATRFWGGKENGTCVQLTLENYSRAMFSCITLEQFRDMVRAIERSVEDNKEAFWHNLRRLEK